MAGDGSAHPAAGAPTVGAGLPTPAARPGGAPIRGAAATGEPTRGAEPVGELYAAVAETHTSTILLLGHRVYKIKKPVKLPFVDLSTRALRLANCHREIELNRRTAPDVYLGVGEFRQPLEVGRCEPSRAGAEPREARGADEHATDEPVPGVAGAGEPGVGEAVLNDPGSGVAGAGEPVVVMRRMPAERSLSSLLKAGRNDEAARCVDEVAELIARFHSALDAEEDYDLPGTMTSLWREGWEQTQRFAGDLLDRGALDETYALAIEYLAGRRSMLTAREQAGLVREGHGDLLADDVYLLDDGPRVLDCLEFDRRLRLGDVLLDLAFLMMDLELHGAPDLARALVGRYRQLGAGQHPRSLEHHYVAYRAWVRVKVECLRHESGDPGARERAAIALDLARSEARAARVHLVAIGGLPGTGKSTVARAIVERDERDWALLSSDRIRKQLAGLDPTTEVTTPYSTGIYDAVHTAATYTEMARRAATALKRGVSVILDASWTDPSERTTLARLAADHHATLTQVRCDAPLDVCRARITARRSGPRVSDADHAVLHGMSQHAAPWPEALTLDTTAPPQTAATQVLEALEGLSA